MLGGVGCKLVEDKGEPLSGRCAQIDIGPLDDDALAKTVQSLLDQAYHRSAPAIALHHEILSHRQGMQPGEVILARWPRG